MDICLILYAGRSLDIMSVMQPTIFLIVGLSALVHYFTQLTKKAPRRLSKGRGDIRDIPGAHICGGVDDFDDCSRFFCHFISLRFQL
ncbi:hypothetical protein [Algoriphagus boritolerans]|uniref:hypothetical protein n=1 Tax=Algoriphagus boritolerans TaxID=308111 RepID=UPI002FCE60B8